MTEVKICGVCRPEDARVAADAGAAYVGVILAPGRTRSRTLSEAARIFDAAGGRVRRVGVFVDAPEDAVIEAARELGLDAVQLHGDESVEQAGRIRGAFAREVWKVVRVREATQVADSAAAFAGNIDALLLDGWSPDAHGGAGVRFDWHAVAHSQSRTQAGIRLIAAGGLTPENVADAVSLLHPSVVDVSSGVEESPGRKSHGKIMAFIAAVRGAEQGQ